MPVVTVIMRLIFFRLCVRVCVCVSLMLVAVMSS